jgi:hypothetical protein
MNSSVFPGPSTFSRLFGDLLSLSTVESHQESPTPRRIGPLAALDYYSAKSSA